ncbi:YigZ family protein [Streptomyces drozdowiczii]|uniref:YigZ family protein n=1 Tax=Streptomyces drozdowiczii TaxID=202862 RepID=A0ABY6PZN5_9ACTN|nr:YigZ family protein [Streptomyces drozdowiczii]MCX0242628.1 YigZ family protein [Streptomyces drozdowiczii]UZK57346.1 YigZ family protein [Streptomyces drozdowiczii]
MQEEYRTVARAGVHESEINRSRFICALAPAATEEEAQEFIARVRREHPTATHNCYAYVIGADSSVQKASDDGEPGGTAGVPMLQMLTRREVCYAVAVVTRYYGGVKLGAGGLIRAYGGVVGEALDALGTRTRRRFRLAAVTVGHQRAGRLENELRATGRTVREVRYGADVTIEIALPDADVEAFRRWLADATAGEARVELGGEAYDDA